VVAPRVGAGCEVVLEDEVGAALVAGLENRLVVPVVGAAPEAGAAELPPPRENSDGADDVAVVAPPVVAVVEAPAVAVLLAGADGLLNKLKPPPVEAAAPPNMLLLGAAEEVGGAVLPPKDRVGVALDAGCAAGVAPRPNDGFAGVEEGVVLPRPPKVACRFGGLRVLRTRRRWLVSSSEGVRRGCGGRGSAVVRISRAGVSSQLEKRWCTRAT
jgi:hypothetical protein